MSQPQITSQQSPRNDNTIEQLLENQIFETSLRKDQDSLNVSMIFDDRTINKIREEDRVFTESLHHAQIQEDDHQIRSRTQLAPQRVEMTTQLVSAITID